MYVATAIIVTLAFSISLFPVQQTQSHVHNHVKYCISFIWAQPPTIVPQLCCNLNVKIQDRSGQGTAECSQGNITLTQSNCGILLDWSLKLIFGGPQQID